MSPLASFVMIFEVTPPGQDENIIIPTASSSVTPVFKMIMNAIIGNNTI